MDIHMKRHAIVKLMLASSVLLALLSAFAEDQVSQEEVEVAGSESMESATVESFDFGEMEELITVGRYFDAATDVINERIKRDVPVDLIDSEFIARVGDSDVASALRRLPGLTLVDDKFVYVRGLGERYSSAHLNGARVPSPDITRNVLPLDIFPADLIDSLAVHKGAAPELTSAFGGGNIDIRTKRIPEGFVLNAGLKSGWNSAGRKGYTYAGGDDDKWGIDDDSRALSPMIEQAIETYRGNIAPLNIFRTEINGLLPGSIDEARAINRSLATFLNRDVDLMPKELPADVEGDFFVGNRFDISPSADVGFMFLGSYANDWRLKDRVNRRFSNPDTDFSENQTTVNSVDLTVSLSLGARLTNDHELGAIALMLRNTEDDASNSRTCVQGQFNDCLDAGSPVQGRIFSTRFEERELEVLQIDGDHILGEDTLASVPNIFGLLDKFIGTEVNWHYTRADASTNIPNEVRIGGQETLDAPNGSPIEFRIRGTGSAADFRFSELMDQSENYGVDVLRPFIGYDYELEVSGGYDYLRKVRDYKQVSLGLGSTDVDFRQVSAGIPSEVFSNDNIMNPDYNINLRLGIGEFGTESYIAVHIVEAGYGKLDLRYRDNWRFSGGIRKEVFTQFSLPIDHLEFVNNRFGWYSEEDVRAFTRSILRSEDWYPSVAMTRNFVGLFGAEQVQLRLVASRTVARPDIRETSASTYIDPITEARVRGNPGLEVSDLTNLDFRFEFFWDSGDNFTTSVFYKDIAKPIETVQGGATEDNVRFNFVNAESAHVYGVELEWLKSLGFMSNIFGEWTDQFFVSGNTTLSSSEISIPPGAGVGNLTNQTRRMSQQSNWVANLQLGFDSFDYKHGATLVYNAFGERIYFAGIDGLPDGFEQPFHGLDLVYSWYVTENVVVKGRVKNMLDSSVTVEQGGIPIFEQSVGTSVLLNISWDY